MCILQFCPFKVFAALSTILFLLIAYYRWAFLYWHRAKLPFLPPRFPFGNCCRATIGEENWAVTTKNFYNEMKKNGWKHGGIYVFTSPNYLPVDLEYIKNDLSADFEYFTDRAGFYNPRDPLSGNLFGTGGFHWRSLRPKLTSASSSGRIKGIFENLEEKQRELVEAVEKERLKGPVNMKEIFFCLTLDIIGSWAFGINLKSFQHEFSEFKFFSKKVVNMSILRRLWFTFSINFSNLSRKLNFHVLPKDCEDFFVATVRDVIKLREGNNENRNDFLQILLEMKKHNGGKFFVTTEDITAQCFFFVIAGFETSASVMTFALYELARNPEIQERLRGEVNSVLGKHDGKISYDSLKEMKFLSQVINETLRMYPPLPLITRKCVKNYKIPHEDVVIEKGTVVAIPILAVHHDEEFYSDPEKFDPERFNDENKKSRPKFAFIPFGGGPRTCIGMHLGFMETKMSLACLIKEYKFFVDEKTSVPLEIEPNKMTLAAAGGIWFNASKIK